jgi:beta-N-acetylhexosaminidase
MRRLVLLTLLLLAGTAAAQPDPITAKLKQMTLRQKVAQMFMVGLFGPNITVDGATFLAEHQPGAIVVFAYNAGTPAAVTRLVNNWQSTITAAGAPPMLVAVDQEGGRINTLEEPPFTHYPVPALVTATGNHNLAYRTGVAQSRELLAVGVNMNLAPVADLETNPDNPVIYRRSYGSDPRIVAPTLSAVVQGMQDTGVIATLKHFPGHGDTIQDSHLELPLIPFDQTALESLELIPFRAGIQAGAEVIMVAHLELPAIDPTPGRPSSLSPPIVTGLLRETLGFDGIIMTDALDMDAIDTEYSLPNASVLAVQAGVDLLATGPHIGLNTTVAAIDTVVAAVESGEITEAQIDASVTRILGVKHRYGLLDWSPLDPTTANQRITAANGPTIVHDLFAAGITIVYDNGLLPLPRNERILMIYPLDRVNATATCTALNPALQRVGAADYPSELQFTEAVRLAENAERVVIFTENAVYNPSQARLVDALPPERTVVVATWSPYDLNAFARLPGAYLTAYSPFDGGIQAACRVLFGDTPARGRLPMHLSDTVLAASGTGLPIR